MWIHEQTTKEFSSSETSIVSIVNIALASELYSILNILNRKLCYSVLIFFLFAYPFR